MAIYAILEEGYEFDRIEADSAEEALDEVDISGGDYDTSDGTVWTRVYAKNEADDSDCESRTFTVEPEEPECSHTDGHDWTSPIELVGGIAENPGVWGHGGGVIIEEVCRHCGCGKTTDTWAQDPSTGEQGLRSVRYEPGKYVEMGRQS